MSCYMNLVEYIIPCNKNYGTIASNGIVSGTINEIETGLGNGANDTITVQPFIMANLGSVQYNNLCFGLIKVPINKSIVFPAALAPLPGTIISIGPFSNGKYKLIISGNINGIFLQPSTGTRLISLSYTLNASTATQSNLFTSSGTVNSVSPTTTNMITNLTGS